MNLPVKAKHMANTYLTIDQKPDLTDRHTGQYLKHLLTNRKNELDPRYTDAIIEGSLKRKLTAFIQLYATENNIDAGPVDGYWGPQTQHAFDSLLFLEEHGMLPGDWRDDPPLERNPNNWPLEDEISMTAFFGPPADESNLVLVDVPYEHKLSWDLRQKAKRIRCNRKVADSLLRVLKKVYDHYGSAKIQELHLDHFGGCYNPRKKRGGSSWSTHAWGIALDYDPGRNQLQWGRDKAVFARPEYAAWWQIWEDEGWVSLGRHKNYDWMHVQAARY